MKTLYNLFLNELSDMRDAEQRIAKALPKLIEAAHSPLLSQALNEHLEETKKHINKVEHVFAAFNEDPRNKTCVAIEGILKEGDQLAREHKGQPSLDAAIICACQKVEHYEMAAYDCLQSWAELMNNLTAVELLEEIIEDEMSASQRLSEIAEDLNPVALVGSEA